MIDLDDLFVRIVPNLSVNEMITPCENEYSVYIKEELPEEKKIEALYHAYVHKKSNDFGKCDIQDIEAKAHYKLESLTEFRKALLETREPYEC